MPGEETQNKIRLDEARRKAVEKRLDKADGIRANMSDDKKLSRRNDLYGKDVRTKESGRYNGKLGKASQALAIAKGAKDIITAPTEIQAMDVPIYGLAFALALLKDLLDLTVVLALPAIGTVITICVSIAIGLILLFDGISVSQRRMARRMTRRFLVLIAGTLAEGILFGLNFFPIETFVVAIIYWMSLTDRKRSAKFNNGYGEVYN